MLPLHMASGVIRRFPDAATAREALLVGRGRMAVDPDALPEAVRATIKATFGQDLSAESVVQRVIADVRARGDDALRHYTRAFDRAEVSDLRVSSAHIDAAAERVGDRVMGALETAAQRIAGRQRYCDRGRLRRTAGDRLFRQACGRDAGDFRRLPGRRGGGKHGRPRWRGAVFRGFARNPDQTAPIAARPPRLLDDCPAGKHGQGGARTRRLAARGVRSDRRS